MTASNTVFTVFSGIGFILSVIPLWWHLPSWNFHVGTCMFMIWTALACLVYFVDSIVWNENTINRAPVWCEIAIRIQIGSGVAWPSCALCVMRRIYNITAKTILGETRRDTVIELLITIGIPVLEMVMQYIVAGHRFDIYEDYGCAPATFVTLPAFFLVFCWPLTIAVVSACYGALTLRAFLRRRKEIKDLDTDSRLSNYWRLAALASVDVFFTIPLAIYGIILTASQREISPWISWEETHWGYSRVSQILRVKMSPVVIRSLELNRWIAVCCAFVFFGFFGFTGEARKNYRLLAFTLANLLGYSAFARDPTTSGRGMVSSIQFASHALDTQHTEATRDSDLFSYESSISSVMDEDDLKAQHFWITEFRSSSRLSNSSIDKAPQVPEPNLGSPFVWRVSLSAIPKVYFSDASNRV